ncbi:MAG: MbnP family copper-binding protein [Myxococcota bacterium]
MRTWACVCSLFLLVFAGACGDSAAEPEPFALQFAAVANGEPVDCATSFSPAAGLEVGVSDLRFYISNLQFWDSDGNEVETSLDENEFQYRAESGWVGLVDLTGNTEGTCAGTAISFAEGTARTNDAIVGVTQSRLVSRVTFDVGVPQAVMQEVIGNNTVEGAPSPLGEMYWTWASGYRHFVMNASLSQDGRTGDAYVHVGSRDCGGVDTLALEDRDRCGFVNTPQVTLDVESLETAVIAVDLAAVVAGLDYVAPVYDLDTFEVIGEDLGVECHSAPTQPDCDMIFSHFGLDMSSGDADASGNAVFLTM